MSEIAPEDFYDSAYYDDYFRPSRLIDEVCFVVQGQEQYSYLLSLGRTRSLSSFNQRVLDKLKALSPILQATMQQAISGGMRRASSAANFTRSIKTTAAELW